MMAGVTSSGASTFTSTSRRSRVGWSKSAAPSRTRQSKKNTESGSSLRRAAASCWLPKRLIVTGNGRGRPLGRSAIASPSRISDGALERRTAATISGTRAVTSFRLRV